MEGTNPLSQRFICCDVCATHCVRRWWRRRYFLRKKRIEPNPSQPPSLSMVSHLE